MDASLGSSISRTFIPISWRPPFKSSVLPTHLLSLGRFVFLMDIFANDRTPSNVPIRRETWGLVFLNHTLICDNIIVWVFLGRWCPLLNFLWRPKMYAVAFHISRRSIVERVRRCATMDAGSRNRLTDARMVGVVPFVTVHFAVFSPKADDSRFAKNIRVPGQVKRNVSDAVIRSPRRTSQMIPRAPKHQTSS